MTIIENGEVIFCKNVHSRLKVRVVPCGIQTIDTSSWGIALNPDPQFNMKMTDGFGFENTHGRICFLAIGIQEYRISSKCHCTYPSQSIWNTSIMQLPLFFVSTNDSQEMVCFC